MEVSCQLASLVFYDDYDGRGYLLGIKRGVLVEIDESDTRVLSALLTGATLLEAAQSLALGEPDRSLQESKAEVLALIKRLQYEQIIEPRSKHFSNTASPCKTVQQSRNETPAACVNPVTCRARLRGAGHIITVLGELCAGELGLYKAHQYIWKLQKQCPTTTIAPASVGELVRKEYWFYRLIVGLLERRTAHLIGQIPGNEGLCLIRALALCAYLLALGISTTVVIARPLYGSRDGFKLHVWVEFDGIPLNERPNIGQGYRRLYAFPGNVVTRGIKWPGWPRYAVFGDFPNGFSYILVLHLL